MSCRKAVCQECATTWDGIHYCSACLAARRKPRRVASDRPRLLVVLAAAAALFWTLTRVMPWAGVLWTQL